MIAVSMMDKATVERAPMTVIKGRMSLSVQMAWLALAVVMVGLYVFFNGH